MISSSFDKPQHFLITGGAGFIGSHLCETLLAAGHRVTVLDNLSTGKIENLKACRSSSQFAFEQGNILDAATVDRVSQGVDIIIHLAAALGVQRILQQPVEMLEVNVLGSHHVMNAAKQHDCRVLLASTSEVYGKSLRTPFSEDDDIMLGCTARSRWGYSASKMLDEFLALAYHQEFQTETIIFRLFNTVGPRQASEYGMVVPRLVRQALRGETLTIYGDGQQTRCFCHVADVVRAIVDLAFHPLAIGKVFNVGNTEEVSILQLAEQIIALSDSDSTISMIPYAEAYPPGFEDMRRRVPNTNRIHELLGWQPRFSLTQILNSVIEYERGMISPPQPITI